MFKKPISINYIKKAPYFGSFEGVSFALIKNDDKIEAYLYQAPFSFENTPDDMKEKSEFEFSEEGYEQAVAWMNDRFKDYETIPHGRRYDLKSIEKICKD